MVRHLAKAMCPAPLLDKNSSTKFTECRVVDLCRACLLQELWLPDDVEHSARCAGDKWGACKGGSMVAGLHGVGHCLGDQHGSDGQAPCMGY